VLFLILLAALSPETIKWNAPVAPFRIAGNVYYVGAAEVSSFLISTLGGTTWTMKAAGHDVVFVGSPSVPSEYRLIGNAKYPNAVDDYRRQFATLESLPCGIFLASHGSFFHLQEKIASKGSFVDPEGYKQFVARMKAAFEARVKQEWTKTSSR
jgi:metallo-beta-lactamase class B